MADLRHPRVTYRRWQNQLPGSGTYINNARLDYAVADLTNESLS